MLPTRRASLRSLLGRCAERWRKGFPRGYTDDSRKSRGRASGGLGAAPPVMRTGGAVASRPRNRPLPKAPAAPAAFPLTARVSGCTGQDGKRQRPGVFRASGDVFRGKLGHQEGFWHGVCFPYLDNLGLTFGCKSILNSRKPAVDAVLREILLCNEKSPISAVATQTEIGGFMLPHFANQRSQRRQRRQKQRRRNCRK